MNAQHTIYTVSGEEIPFFLRHIAKPPDQLWVESNCRPDEIGQLTSRHDDTKYLCVVGARKHSSYAREACERLISDLSGYNICIVSGLALGIDSIAHEAALEAGLRTISFPGSGLDRSVLYPPSRHRLAERIVEAGGALISEYPPEQPSMQWTFPQRNRLMAGFCHATLIIEAADNSGTLITAMHANEEGRNVLALPGSIFSPLTYGPHKLIHGGATIVRSYLDILEALNIKPEDSKSSNEKNCEGNSKKIDKNAGKTKLPLNLSKTEKEILETLATEPQSRDEIIFKTGIDITTLNTHISMLEMRDIVRIQGGLISLKL